MYYPGQNLEAWQRYCEGAAQKGYSCKNSSPNCTGQCVSMAAVILPAKLLLRNVYRVLASKKSWHDTVTLTIAAREDLK